MTDPRVPLLAVLAFSGCFPWEQVVAECYDRGHCLRDAGEVVDAGDASDAGTSVDAGVDRELARWPLRSPPAAPFQVGADTVLDKQTLLVWQKAVGGQATWSAAMRQCEGLNTLGFGGVPSGWRLPTAIELLSLVDVTKRGPAIDTAAFPGTASEAFWSASTGTADGGAAAWQVGFELGNTRLDALDAVAQVRCVTCNEPTLPSPRYLTDVAAGVVVDAVTSLTWERDVTKEVDLAGARAHCAGLALEGLDGGWRLPTKRELETLVNRRDVGTMIDAHAFATSVEAFFWSSSPLVGGGAGVSWGVDFSDDRSTFMVDTFVRNARCVH